MFCGTHNVNNVLMLCLNVDQFLTRCLIMTNSAHCSLLRAENMI